MEYLGVYRARKEIEQAILKRGYRVEPFQNLINVYLGMVKEQIILDEVMQREQTETENSNLLEIRNNLSKDIEDLKQRFIT